MLIDTHTHVNFKAFKDDADDVVKRALDSGVWIVNAGTKFETSRSAVELAENYSDGVYAAVALHPIHLFEHRVDLDEEEASFHTDGEEFEVGSFRDLVARSTKVVAIGEFGLDYYRLPKEHDHDAIKQKQKDVMIKHIELAKEIDKPLMIHCRPAEGSMDAYQDVLKILDENYRSPNFEIHCFTGDAPTAMEFVKRGGLVALNGIITFDKTGRSDKVVKNLPLESTIFETDAPFLTPLPHRGKRNEPSYVRFVAEKLAQMKGIDISKVEEVTTANARRLFRI
ncbi:MAG: hypothetical protein A3C85_02700 [Candidatus Doudnabacteria bacterium RIFCSPHIGHO2_02_FULL_48_21]|uniref:Hydrolase TatD n=1 Tax=Candidatus Doudnabacteria bacterium RIFCSPLOWO2_02_FULL_48_13 TaxID=1817845 RepID=A0A1F5Q9I0_9BACT|nr:MAG: hypothetical protein A3K05_03545 [Candidatus Doudnabacteria bacterium RIFCSPHIGHO2_01_48_18]OGE79488.1 MAG: hypothetical protein A2668_00085 [Candidatus Doudnabacteria bacterium RIFCSPHIGHO2_01_FULL_48_180]OGE91321.1 MAG: hypothetical protein A3F44_03360 [Candidatus Doudnabacteria bacterium RIFCSPHIGHO2_12_FULL_47_25]OGE92866.1 MAG: hypothetical protein A3C85_02700 [Candidatus Doudnabacteria bacterium RIFCSPHIGHO2_02_FULL_48_21]OGE96652.1 MAG: hypothetical protein A3A83_01635 [Candidatu